MNLFKRRIVGAQADSEDAERHESDELHQSVHGDRGAASVSRASSLQSRVSNAMAIGLMSILGLGILTWYYTRTYSQSGQEREQASAATRARAQGDVALPPIGPIESPSAESGLAENLLGPEPEAPPPDDIPDAWLEPAKEMPSPPPVYGPPVKSPEELALERKLSGPVGVNTPTRHAGAAAPSVPQEAVVAPDSESAAGPEALGGLLKASVTPAARARVLPTQHLLLAKGAFLDCTLETAIDSTLAGMTTCVTATDTFGVDGSVVLMERGTKLIGETRGQVQQGSARIFVVWTEARTPTGVVIPLASPGTDELGRSGLAGHVNRHFWDRFGAAILISVIDGVIQREVQAQSRGDGAVIYNPSASQDVMTEVLKSTVNIPPTVTKNNGDRIQVLVARDLDFRSVYELRPASR